VGSLKSASSSDSWANAMFFEAIAAIIRISSRNWEVALESLRGTEETRQLLHRERSRCDRSGNSLSLLCFTAPDGNRRVFLHLLPILKKRLRSTDDMGWLDEKRIGVLLPDTPSAGAWTVVESICQSWPAKVPPPECEVYTYPHPGPDKPKDPAPVPEPDTEAAPLQLLLVRAQPAWKRCLDIIGAGIALVLLSPLLLVIALAIKLTSPGGVLFRQRRSGLGGRPFTMYKFRTMVAGAESMKPALRAQNEQDGPAFKLKNDPRVTRLGRFLRKTSLDELPQLWNVLRGDMSLVGPRPLPCDETSECSGWHLRRLDVLPGLTCIWQVRGRCRVTFTEWMRMDMQYLHSQSMGQDLKLILQTIPALVSRRGAQ
jgi:lipopolysaccharide/colanic/teichoic acid biosynthesis glycosyltransferase